MKTKVRKSIERGRADHGWLDSRHTFSFGDYQDPQHMGFRSLRVINQDVVAAGAGFPTHPHRDMEIFSYVISGELEHQDSMGNQRRLQPGEIQLMSAGTGVLHSEFNASEMLPVHFLQVWIRPSQSGLEPSYSEWKPSAEREQSAKVLMISGDGRDGSARIHQDVDVWRIRLEEGASDEVLVREGRGTWVQVVRGQIRVADQSLSDGDAFSTELPGPLSIQAHKESEILVFDLA